MILTILIFSCINLLILLAVANTLSEVEDTLDELAPLKKEDSKNIQDFYEDYDYYNDD